MGGSAREWRSADGQSLPPGAAIELRLVLTNFSSAETIVGYEVVLVS
ncbi:MAG: hypothetical protein ACE5GB_05610 [Acidimicrobiales bacterium]